MAEKKALDLDHLERLNRARTQGEWYRESDDEGDGRYLASFLKASDLSRDYDTLADSINSTASEIHDESDEDGVYRWDDVARRNFEFIAEAANAMGELIRLARIGQREEQQRANIVNLAIYTLSAEQKAIVLKCHEHFSDTIPEAPRGLINECVRLGFVDKVSPGRWEFNAVGEGVVAALSSQGGV